ncbi:MAG: HAD family hydrolase [Clostridia bacterium]|nr:HAD family hydrolase [Clostridia bacterium]
MFAGVLFDFDGTMVDTTELIVKSFQHVLRSHLNRTIETEELFPYFGMTLREGLASFVPDKVDEMIAEYRRFSDEHFDDLVYLCPGVKEGLRQLRAAGVKLGVVTSRARQTTLYGLQLFDLQDYFQAVVTMDDVSSYKPQPDPVLKGVELLRLDPAEVVMIGDSPHDIMAARAAGVTSVAAGWSKIPRERLLAAQPDAIVDSMAEFVDFCISQETASKKPAARGNITQEK